MSTCYDVGGQTIRQWIVVVDYVPGENGGWEAHLDYDPEIGWASSDPHTLMAAISRDLAEEART